MEGEDREGANVDTTVDAAGRLSRRRVKRSSGERGAVGLMRPKTLRPCRVSRRTCVGLAADTDGQVGDLSYYKVMRVAVALLDGSAFRWVWQEGCA